MLTVSQAPLYKQKKKTVSPSHPHTGPGAQYIVLHVIHFPTNLFFQLFMSQVGCDYNKHLNEILSGVGKEQFYNYNYKPWCLQQQRNRVQRPWW